MQEKTSMEVAVAMRMNRPTYHEGMAESNVIKELGAEKRTLELEACEREYSEGLTERRGKRNYIHADGDGNSEIADFSAPSVGSA